MSTSLFVAVQHDNAYRAGQIFGEILIPAVGVALIVWAAQRIKWRQQGDQRFASGWRLVGLVVGLSVGLLLIGGDVGGIVTRASKSSIASETAPDSYTEQTLVAPNGAWPDLRPMSGHDLSSDPFFGPPGMRPLAGYRGTGPHTIRVNLPSGQIQGAITSNLRPGYAGPDDTNVYLAPAGQAQVVHVSIGGPTGSIVANIPSGGSFDLTVEAPARTRWSMVLGTPTA